jgi:hypothetical protein
MTFPVNAGSEQSDLLQPINLWAGEAPIITGQANLTGQSVSYKRGQVFILGADGVTLSLPDVTASAQILTWFAGQSKVILAQDTDFGSTSATVSVPIYTGGFFNIDVLIFPPVYGGSGTPLPITTDAQKKQVFAKEIAGGTIKLGKVLS